MRKEELFFRFPNKKIATFNSKTFKILEVENTAE